MSENISHWLETAYSRICAGEAEANVLRDYGLIREEAFTIGVEHLRQENERLRGALQEIVKIGSRGCPDRPEEGAAMKREDYIERIWAEAKLLYLEESEELIPTLITLAYSDGMDAEREACAKLCDKEVGELAYGNDDWYTAKTLAEIIRARGEV